MGTTNSEVHRDLFGEIKVGYLLVESNKLEQWKTFATQGMGMHLAYESDVELGFRLDGQARRFIIQRGNAEDVVAIGLEVGNSEVLETLLERIREKGGVVSLIDDERAVSRGVNAYHRLIGPKGLAIELFVDPITCDLPVDMLCHSFVTGDAGLGHISIMSKQAERTVSFWQEVFNARVSDTIRMAVGGREAIHVSFLRFNHRHHSIAIAATSGIALDMYATKIQHFNLEVSNRDDLTACYERCVKLGYKISRNVGQHPNDKVLSFYVVTPSGFEFELGWGAVIVEESCWQSDKSYDKMSNWGHDVPGFFSFELDLSHIVNIIRNARKEEYFPW